MSRLYPPIINGTIPAFYGATLVVPFSLNRAVSSADIRGIRIKIKTTTGILKENIDRCVRIPMSDKVRSLNLSNCAALCIYEVLRQQDYPNLSKVEVQKGEDFLYDL